MSPVVPAETNVAETGSADMERERIVSLWLETAEKYFSHLNDVPLSIHAAEMRGSRSAINAHMAGLQLAYRRALTRLNVLLPISRVPDEILARIFAFTAVAEGPEYNPNHGLYYAMENLSPMSLSRVCRRWRDVVLTNPAVWCRPLLSFTRKWASTMFERAKTVPLYINLSRSYPSPSVYQDKALLPKIIAQTQSIELDFSPYNTTMEKFEAFVRCLTMPAPLLEYLSIVEEVSYGWSHRSSLPTLPENLFNNDTPRIRTVHLDKYFYYFPWNSAIFSHTVVDLKVALNQPEGITLTPPNTCTYSKLLEALRRMKRLEHLSLDSCITHALAVNPKAKIPVRAVPLHLLTSLTLRDTAPSCALFLRQLKIPARTRIKITCLLKYPILPGAEELTQALDAHYASGAALRARVGLHKLEVQQYEAEYVRSDGLEMRTTVSIKAWTRPRKWHDAKRDPQVEIQLRPLNRLTMVEREFVLRDLCIALPLKSLRVLDLSRLPYNLSAPVWIDAFRRARKVRSISVSAPAALSLSRAIGRDIAHAESGAQCRRSQADLQRPLGLPRFLFPWLTKLTMSVLDEQTARELDLSCSKRYLRTTGFKRVDGAHTEGQSGKGQK